MLRRTWRDQQAHEHHHHGDEVRTIDTGHGALTLEIFEDGVPPCWRIRFFDDGFLSPENVTVETVRANGARQTFNFMPHDGFLQSVTEIPEPHAFAALLRLPNGNQTREFNLEFHEHEHPETEGLIIGTQEFADAHERAHADDIKRRFANRHVSTGQIVMFGLTGGLIPCPASITILLLCLQLKQFTLGATLVLCFSIGLAVTMVSVGAAAALSVRHISRRWTGFGEVARRTPYLSGALIIAVGLYTGYLGWVQLLHHA